MFGDNARVDVGSLYVSTRELGADQFSAFEGGNNPLTAGDIKGDVVNLGKLNATNITVEGNNISFKNVADVTKGGTLTDGDITGGTAHNDSSVKLTANSTGEIHIGSSNGGTPAYSMMGTDNKYMYTLVSTPNELQAIGNDDDTLAGNYMLANDIDFNDGSFTANSSHFKPIGYVRVDNEYTNSNIYYNFQGKFDGLNYKIKNLKITDETLAFFTDENRVDRGIGLFGYSRGTIENVGVENTNINVNKMDVGGIVGWNNNGGTIRNVYHTGTVIGQRNVGGIVGYSGSGRIEKAYNTGNIDTVTHSGDDQIGGIVGRAQHTNIHEVYNIGDIGSEGKWYVGGIVGNFIYINPNNNKWTIEDAYNEGSVTGDRDVGGIAGAVHVLGNNTVYGEHKNTYNTGAVSGSANTGEIYGFSYDKFYNSFYSNGYFDAEGVEHTDSSPNLKAKNTFTNWSISSTGGEDTRTTWRIYEGQTTPLLTAFLKTKDVITETEYNGSAQPFDENLVTGDSHIYATNGGVYASETNAGKYDGLTGGKVLYSDQQGYDLVDTKLIIQPKSVSLINASKTYDGTTDVNTSTLNLNTAEIIGSDSDKVALVNSKVTGAYSDKNVGDGKAITYTIADGDDALTGAAAGNYIISAAGTGEITAKELIVTFGDISKTYDGTTSATAGEGTLSGGIISGDTVTLDTAGITAEYADKNAGTGNKTVNYSGIALTGTDAGNYSIAETAQNTTSTIDPKKLTVTFAEISKTYDGTQEDRDSDGNAVESRTASGVDGVVAGETISVTGKATYSTASADDVNSQTVNYSELTPTGTTASNYTVTVPEGGVTGSGKIFRKELTVGNITKEYDGTEDATITKEQLIGLVNSDTDSISISSGVTATYISDDASVNPAEAGTGKKVDYSGLTLSGSAAGNYTITASGISTTNNSITPKVLTASSVSKVYDGTDAATLHLSDLLGTDGLPGVVERDESDLVLTTNSAAYASKNAGTGNVTFNGISLTGDKAHNYTINDSITVQGTITRKALELVAKEVTIRENEQIPSSFDGSIIGFIDGEGQNISGLVFSLANPMTTPVVGSYRIVGTLNGDENGDYGLNYTFQNAASNATAFTVKPILAVLPALDFRGASVNVTIDKSEENKLLIDSTKLYNTLKWIDFSIGENGTVQFDDKNYLNYVTGHGRSDIDGTITGRGAIYLINPNGVLFGSTAQVNVGNLYVSSRTLDSTALNAFETDGTNPLATQPVSATGNIINRGTLKAAGITVEGNNVSFKNYADVTATGTEGIKVRADGEVHVGFSNGEEAAAVNDTEYKTVSEPELANWDFKKTDNTTAVTPEKYMLVRNAYELQNMKNNLLGNYMLANDIEFKNDNGGYIIGQFIPIGSLGGWTDYREGMFKGKLDGLYHVIRDIYIDNTAITQNSNRLTDIGIIGSNAGIVENLGVINGNVNITNSGASAVGGIVGANKPGGIIRNVYFSGSVKGGRTGTGGVAGWQNVRGLTENAYATGTVTSSYSNNPDSILGVIGVTGGSIKNAYFSGKVRNNNMNELYKSDGTRQTLTNTDMMKLTTFNSDGAGWDITADGSQNTTWRIYEGKTTPLLTAFLKTKSLVTEKEYNGEEQDFDQTLVTGNSHVIELDSVAYSAKGTNAGVYDETKEFYSDSQQGYNIVDTKLVIQPKKLRLDNTKVYDGTTSVIASAIGLKSSDIIGNDAVTLADGSVTGGLYADKNVGDDKAVTYTIADSTLGGTNADNYILTVKGTGTITPKEITANFAEISKVYDGTINDVDENGTAVTSRIGTLTGVVEADAEKVDVTATATYDKKDAGDRSVAYTGVTLTGEEAANYSIATTATGAGTITQREISVAFGNISKIYDGLTSSNTIGDRTFTNVIDADAGKVDVTATATYDEKNVGDRSVAYTGVTLTGEEAANYSIADTATGAGTITQRGISVAFGNISKVYDGLTTSDTIGSRTFTNVVEADAEKVDVTATATYDDKNVGNRSVAYTNVKLTGEEAANYSIAETATGAGTITQREISVAFGDISKVYDGLTSSETIGARTFTNVVEADAEKVDVTATATYDEKNVGDRSVAYTGVTLTGEEAANYSIAETATGAGTISKREISVAFGDISKTYDGLTTSDTIGERTFTNVVDADAEKVDVTATATYDKKDAGSRNVAYTGVSLTGAEAGNYSIAETATGAGTISKREISVAFGDISKVYDGLTSSDTIGERTFTNVVEADAEKVDVTATATYDKKDAGSRSVAYTGVTLTGAEAGNYSIADTGTGAGTISKREISVAFGDISKVYDGLTSSDTIGERTFTNVVDADSEKVDVTATATYDEKNAGSRNVAYTNVKLTGDESKNYSIAETATGAGTITAKEITVTFADISKVYDGTTSATAGEGTLDGVVDGDKGKVEVTATAAYDSKDAGNRTINYTGVELSGAEAANYTIAGTLTGKGTIKRKALELVADPASTEYGDYNPASFTGRVDGFVTGESISSGDSLVFALSDPSASAVGSYGITGTINGSASGEYGLNYTFTNAASNENAFTIYARPASVQDMVLSDIIPGIKGRPGADISVTALDDAMEQARDKRAEVGIEFAVAQTILSVDADKTLSLENQGMKQPPSMTAQEVAEQVHAQQTDNTTGTEENKRKKGAA